MIRTTRTIAPLIVLAFGAPLHAQDARPSDDAPALSGPSVEPEAKPLTLVRRGYDGRLQPIDAPPEVAALDLLALDPETRDRIDPILADRAAIIDGVVIRNIPTLVELQGARAAGDTQAQRRLLSSLVDQLRDLRLRGRLVDQIKGVLPPELRNAYQRLVRERHLAVLDELRAEAESEGVGNPDAVAARRFFAETLGQEIRASYDRVVTQNTQRLDELLAELDLDPETEGEVRRLLTDFGQRTALNPTPEQRRDLFAQIYRILPPEARARLVERFRPAGDE